MINNHYDPSQFETDWTAKAVEVCKSIYKHSKIAEYKTNLEKNGFLTLEEKSGFIDICDMVKYQIIYEKIRPGEQRGLPKIQQALERVV